MNVILYDSERNEVHRATLDKRSKAPHVILWNGGMYVRFGVQDTLAYYEPATVATL